MVKRVIGSYCAYEFPHGVDMDENAALFSVQRPDGSVIGGVATVIFTGTITNGTAGNPVFNGWVKLIVTSGGMIVADGGGIKEAPISNLGPGASVNVNPYLVVRDTDGQGNIVAKAELYRSDFTLLKTIGPTVVGINTGVDQPAPGEVTLTGTFSIS